MCIRDRFMDKLKEYTAYLKEHQKIARAAAIVLIMIAAVVFFGHNGEKEEIPVQLPEETAEQTDIPPKESEKTDIFVAVSYTHLKDRKSSSTSTNPKKTTERNRVTDSHILWLRLNHWMVQLQKQLL